MVDSSSERRRGGRPGGFAFAHLLTREAAYDALLAANRRALHSAAADVLAGQIVAGSPDELTQLSRLVAQLAGAERWFEAHERSCAVLNRRSHHGSPVGWEDKALEAAELWRQAQATDPALPEHSAALANAWSLHLSLIGRTDEARTQAELALTLARATGDRAQEALALNNCGITFHYSGRQDQAAPLYLEALAIQRARGDVVGEIQALNNAGLALHEQGQSMEAKPYLAEGLALARRTGHLLLEANLAQSLGVNLLDLGETGASVACFEKCLTAARLVGDRLSEGLAQGSLGQLAVKEGRYAAGCALLRQALAMCHEVQQPRFIAWWTIHLALAEGLAGHAAVALALSAEGMRLAGHCNDQLVVLHAQVTALEVALLAGRTAEAAALLHMIETAAENAHLLSTPLVAQKLTELRTRLDAVQARS